MVQAKSADVANLAIVGNKASQPSHKALETPNQTPQKPRLLAYATARDHVVVQSTRRKPKAPEEEDVYLVDEEYLVTALVPSDTACLASSPGRMSRTLAISDK